MITFDVHDVRAIHARAHSSECGRFGWVKLTMGGPKELVEITAYMPIAQATLYANAINSAQAATVVTATVVTEQKREAA